MLISEFQMPTFEQTLHKGDIGKVMIIGGSPIYYGAPILTALGAEASGSDLIYLYIPSMHIETAKKYSLNFFIHHFTDVNTGYMGLYDVKKIHDIAANVDAIIIGNGLSKDFDVKKTVLSILSSIDKPVVIDADALVPEIMKIYDYTKHDWVLTPHHAEFRRVFGADPTLENIEKVANQYMINMCVKGHIDYIIAGRDFTLDKSSTNSKVMGNKVLYRNETGVVQMKVGGTGDVLAGIIGGYISQGLSALQAMRSAVYLWGKCGEMMYEKQVVFSAKNLVKHFPKCVTELMH